MTDHFPSRFRVQQSGHGDHALPDPLFCDAAGRVRPNPRREPWPTDLVGFQRKLHLNEVVIDVTFADFAADPRQAVGTYPVVRCADGGVAVLEPAVEQAEELVPAAPRPRGVDTLPERDEFGRKWTWLLTGGAYRGRCRVAALLFEVELTPASTVTPGEYVVHTTASFGGYALFRERLRFNAALSDLTPEKVLELVEEADLLREALVGAHVLVARYTLQTGEDTFRLDALAREIRRPVPAARQAAAEVGDGATGAEDDGSAVPLPWQRVALDGVSRLVVATAPYDTSAEPGTWVALALNPEPPYFTLLEVRPDGTAIREVGTFHDIVPAIGTYSEHAGGH